MRKSIPKILLAILIIALIASNIYFISKAMEPSIDVQVGLPIFNEKSEHTATIMSPFITKKEEANPILLAFMLGRPMEEDQFPTDLPNGYLVIHYKGCGYPHKMWITEDSVIFETSTESRISYRLYQNDHNNMVPLLKNILDSLKNNKFS